MLQPRAARPGVVCGGGGATTARASAPAPLPLPPLVHDVKHYDEHDHRHELVEVIQGRLAVVAGVHPQGGAHFAHPPGVEEVAPEEDQQHEAHAHRDGLVVLLHRHLPPPLRPRQPQLEQVLRAEVLHLLYLLECLLRVGVSRRLHLHGELVGELRDRLAELAHVRHLHADARRHAPPDLHHPREHPRVVVALRQCRDRHHLWDGAELEDLLVGELGHVVEAVGHVRERVGHQVVQALHRRVRVLLLLEVLELVGVVPPDLLGPEHAGRGQLVDVLQVVADDVRLLQELAHGVGDLLHLQEVLALELGHGEQLGQAHAHQPRHIEAVLVVLLHLLHFLGNELRHARAHAAGDLCDDVLVLRLELDEGIHHQGILLHQAVVLPSPDVHDEASVCTLFIETQQHGDLLLHFNGHVILNRVQRAKYEVEHAHRIT
mmetsp:Transcript_17480/g.38078  ORF Transcript_17480/g.38078 Transcript_17480/m.38078 type:complete len:432 (-) Transcript_17480:279-1574(-)